MDTATVVERTRSLRSDLITFQVERWETLWRDGQALFPLHYEELSLDRDTIPLAMDADKYQEIENRGQLHVLTCRCDGKLIGYYIALLVIHPHYKDSGLQSTTDMFWIHPDYRKGGTGAKLIMEAERTLHKRGVKKAFIGTKLKANHRLLLEAMGWTATDMVFTKIL